uniref:(northern house mosquito) hypothetical protein n=1 Tax=Culex pipiens TaxID=7175 RepID=A0A8D8GXE8_CULPI
MKCHESGHPFAIKWTPVPAPFFFSLSLSLLILFLILPFVLLQGLPDEESRENRFFLPQHPQQAVLLWQFQANTAEGMGINIPKATLLLPFIAGSSFPRIHYSSGPGKTANTHTECRSSECNRHRVDFQIKE